MQSRGLGDVYKRQEISNEEIPGSKRSMCGYILTYSQALNGERLSSVFSQDGTLKSASADPHSADDLSLIAPFK